MSSTARSKAASFCFDGCVVPLTLRTNCNDADWISSRVAGGSKLYRVFMFLHRTFPRNGQDLHLVAGTRVAAKTASKRLGDIGLARASIALLTIVHCYPCSSANDLSYW